MALNDRQAWLVVLLVGVAAVCGVWNLRITHFWGDSATYYSMASSVAEDLDLRYEARDILRVERTRDPSRPLSETDDLVPVRTRADMQDAIDRSDRWGLISNITYGVGLATVAVVLVRQPCRECDREHRGYEPSRRREFGRQSHGHDRQRHEPGQPCRERDPPLPEPDPAPPARESA